MRISALSKIQPNNAERIASKLDVSLLTEVSQLSCGQLLCVG